MLSISRDLNIFLQEDPGPFKGSPDLVMSIQENLPSQSGLCPVTEPRHRRDYLIMFKGPRDYS